MLQRLLTALRLGGLWDRCSILLCSVSIFRAYTDEEPPFRQQLKGDESVYGEQ